jgi:NMD protein affecting ribosome stability and mRNA decay
MLKNAYQAQITIGTSKCAKCGKRDATREDKLCDHCRFLQNLINLTNNEKQAK